MKKHNVPDGLLAIYYYQNNFEQQNAISSIYYSDERTTKYQVIGLTHDANIIEDEDSFFEARCKITGFYPPVIDHSIISSGN